MQQFSSSRQKANTDSKRLVFNTHNKSCIYKSLKKFTLKEHKALIRLLPSQSFRESPATWDISGLSSIQANLDAILCKFWGVSFGG